MLERFGLGEEDTAAWRESRAEFEDWLVDRVARRPAGARAKAVYGADDIHDFARARLLAALQLDEGDRLLDVGCGGGLLLRDASAAGAAVVGVDHSEDMVALARERVPQAEIVLARAEELPFADASFTAVTLVMVLLFLREPVTVLRECRRVLRAGGRLAAYTPGPSLRGTPAAPEPLAGRSFFHSDAEMRELALSAGFPTARVEGHEGTQVLLADA